ncbi:MAG: oxygen-independent coproporphyrinogen III oxidase [Kangiella sp.]|nr:MAG: oxygen-independent coproporphyrinogen III oxidase [Kangiella sp.]
MCPIKIIERTPKNRREKIELDSVELCPDILDKYNISGPRYTSYPTALEFNQDYTADDYSASLRELPDGKSLSLYIHIPFCQHICYYCACNKIITKHRSKSEQYVEYLIKEIELVAEKMPNRKQNPLRQIHWGGGTPTYLSIEQITQIMQQVRLCFYVPDEASTEISIEVDPRAIAIEDVKKLADLGFNRMSIGVQDFDDKVQKAVNRVQSFELTRDTLLEARLHGFKSINLDLIYGLPFQTPQTFNATIKKVIDISPDRISVFNYAHLPHRFKPQRRISGDDLPSASEKLAIFQAIIKQLQANGYLYIGMDHFAKPTDELAIAQQEGKLHRNFQGYTTHEEYDLIGIGVSSIGSIDGHYHQNLKVVESYYNAIDKNEIPTWRGTGVGNDDRVRKAVIFALICHFELDILSIELEFNIVFKQYFQTELVALEPFVDDELIAVNDEKIEVNSKGRLLIRNICMVFDAYMNELHLLNSFSKVI